MKTIFIINPKAGQGKGIDKLKEKIRQASEKTGVPAGIYITRGPGDAQRFAQLYTEEALAQGATQGTPAQGATQDIPVKGATQGTPAKGATQGTPAQGATQDIPVKGATQDTPAQGATQDIPALCPGDSGSRQSPGRLIACGGDGTLNEVLNGVLAAQTAAEAATIGVGNTSLAGRSPDLADRAADGSDPTVGPQSFPRVAIGVLPIGTGNDFVRNFPDAGDFMDPAAQLLGRVVRCDAIRYWGDIDGRQQSRYCANMFNIGFDCNVVDMAARLKTYPLVAGSFAYLLAVAVTFIKKKGASLKVELDGKLIEDGQVLLTAIGNGGFCGGGVHSSPYACLEDGKMEVNVIYNVKRLDFLKKFPYYAKGTYNELPDIDRILCARTCERARITPLTGTMRLCTDGEIVDAGTVDFEMAPGAFDMVVPV